jgi:hypothetical protein
MQRFAIAMSLLASAASACSDDKTSSPTPDAGDGSGSGSGSGSGQGVDPNCPGTLTMTTCRLTDNIAQSVTFAAKYSYVIPRLRQLFVEPGVTLTVEPGTTVKGEQGSVLVITRGAKIIADGTKDKTIVFTSSQAEGSRTAGWWGGLLILGKAPVNAGKKVDPAQSKDEAIFEAFTSSIPEGYFGGTDPHDNSGTLRYVRIEFAGFNFINDREFNNLTLCGVGDATVIDFVQVHGGSDDGIELFGGRVNVKHLVSSQNQDDGFDTDNGWQGKAQFVVIQNVAHPAGLAEASNGYESDNFPADVPGILTEGYKFEPRTEPTISNVTIIGDHDYATANRNFAAVFRRGTGGHYFNHIWLGFQRGPEIRDAATEDQAIAGKLEVKFSMFFGNDSSATQMPPAQTAGDIDESKYLTSIATVDPHNVFDTDPGLTDPKNKTAPNFKPKAGAAALTAGTTPPADPFFDATATFAGAIGADDWTEGWTRYPQN